MVAKKKDTVPLGERTVQYRRAKWKNYMRWFGFLVVVGLNISMVASNWQMRMEGHGLEIGKEIGTYVVLLFFDVFILLPVFLEVHTVDITPDSITLRGMFRKRKFRWKDVTAFTNSSMTSFAMLRAGKSIYLLNKKDLKPHEELFEIIQFKRAKAIQ